MKFNGSLAKKLCLCVLLSFGYGMDAEAKQLAVKLESIKRIARQEDRSDELYFSVTEFSTARRPDTYQVPSFPGHWLSPYLNNLKDVTLWQRDIEPSESVQIIFSLIERDVPPWNVDDLLGSVKLNFKLKNDAIEKQWTIPNQEITRKIVDSVNTYRFVGDGADYEVTLRLKEVR